MNKLMALAPIFYFAQAFAPALVKTSQVSRIRIGSQLQEEVPKEPIKAPRPTRKDFKSKGGTAPPKRSNQGKALEKGMTNPSRLRVMGGAAKGRRLDSPEVQLRPMMGKVKEALFSTLTGFGVYEQPGTRHLDLFSGSGSVGIEALSRGARQAVFVDFAKECCEVAEKNVEWCGFDWDGAGRAVCASVFDVLRAPQRFGLGETFDVVTVTPPYEEISYAELVDCLVSSPLVGEDTIVALEYPVEMGTLPPVLGDRCLVGVRNRRYGRTVVATYVCKPTGRWNLDLRSEEFVNVAK